MKQNIYKTICLSSSSKMSKELNLMVAEAVDEDKNKNLIRVSQNYLNDLGIKVGEIVDILGKKRALAIAGKSWPGDTNLNIIRIDKIIRENAGINLGEIISIKKSNQLTL